MEQAAEACVIEATEQVDVWTFAVEARGSTVTGGEVAATARRVVAGQLTPLPPGANPWETDWRGPMPAP
jgi:hypothetical protein